MGLANYLVAHWKGFFNVFVIAFFVIAMLLNDALPYRCLYVIICMYLIFVTESMSRMIAGMIPICSFPLLNILISDKVCMASFMDYLVTFVISAMITNSLELAKIPIRVVTWILKTTPMSPRGVQIYMSVLSAFVSIFVPNSVAAAFMMPIARAFLLMLKNQGLGTLFEEDDDELPVDSKVPTKLTICIYQSTAFACSIGGCITMMGSDVNRISKIYYDARFPNSEEEIGLNYIVFALPVMIILLLMMILCMQILYMGLFGIMGEYTIDFNGDAKGQAREMANNMHSELGPLTGVQYMTILQFILLTILLLTLHPDVASGWHDKIGNKHIEDATPIVIVLFLLFVWPGNFYFLLFGSEKSGLPTPALINWKTIQFNTPWGIIFYSGCGGAVADGARASGLAREIGNGMSNISNLPPTVGAVLIITIMLFCTNFTVDGAVAMVMMPPIIEWALKSKVHPLRYMLPSMLTCNMCFMTATGSMPNILASRYGNIRGYRFFCIGLMLTLITFLVIFIFSFIMGLAIYGNLNKLPSWYEPGETWPDYGDA